MNSFSLETEDLNYVKRQYTAFLESYVTVTNQAVKAYMQAWTEFFTSPQKLMKRNMAYFQEVVTPPRPQWQTPHKVMPLPAKYSKLIKLLDFSQDDIPSEGVIPTLLLPPQAGHHSYIADYTPDQSQVQTLRHCGLGGVYCIEWLSATYETRNTTVEDYIELINYVIKEIGGKANLVGDCQGGWLATIYAAYHPDTVNTLVVAGAPIDFQAGDGPIKQWVNFASKVYPDNGMAFYRQIVKLGNGMLNGNMMITGFNIMRPQQLPERFIHLYQTMHDEHAVTRFKQMKNWYDYAQNIPGTFYLWLVEHLFRDNELIHDKLVVGGKRLMMKDITCPVFLLGGKRDHITPPVQVTNLKNFVGTPADKIYEYVVPAGHIGLFMGKDILRSTWSVIGRKMLEYSKIEKVTPGVLEN